jgi:hypothetical protein
MLQYTQACVTFEIVHKLELFYHAHHMRIVTINESLGANNFTSSKH